MKARREYRGRADVDVAVLDALVDRSQEGMTVFELRSEVDVEIDEIESALAGLRADRLIEVEEADGRTLIYPAEKVVPEPGEAAEQPTLVDEIRRRLPF